MEQQHVLYSFKCSVCSLWFMKIFDWTTPATLNVKFSSNENISSLTGFTEVTLLFFMLNKREPSNQTGPKLFRWAMWTEMFLMGGATESNQEVIERHMKLISGVEASVIVHWNVCWMRERWAEKQLQLLSGVWLTAGRQPCATDRGQTIIGKQRASLPLINSPLDPRTRLPLTWTSSQRGWR